MTQEAANKETVLRFARRMGRLTTQNVVQQFDVSRQFANRVLAQLVAKNLLMKVGATRGTFYVTPEFIGSHPDEVPNVVRLVLSNTKLQEHEVLEQVEQSLRGFAGLPENIRSIFRYAFSEMLNNAIEHSGSSRILLEVILDIDLLRFTIEDFGIGVFRSIQRKRGLASEIEAMQDLLKGKTTTMPASHSGEGIFFTSKAGDQFQLLSFGHELIVDTTIPDVFIHTEAQRIRGTIVSFTLSLNTQLHLKEVFDQFANVVPGSDFGFDKTEVLVRLYTLGGVHISRSQARRILAGLDKFKLITLDYDRVPVIGQAFADEIYRVFQQQHPEIEFTNTNMNEGVAFMVQRAITEAKRRLTK